MTIPSLPSSVGSKSSRSSKQNRLISNIENSKPLRSFWIRRLLSNPPHRPPNLENPSQPQLALQSSSTAGSDGSHAVLGHITTISTDESRTASDFHSLAAGFGPLQVRTRRSFLHAAAASAERSFVLPNSSIDSNQLAHQELHLDRNGGEHGGIGNCSYRNSFNLRKLHIDEEEERRGTRFCRIGDYGGSGRKTNWLHHHNGEKMVVEERILMERRSRSLRAEGMVSKLCPERRVIEGKHGLRLSPFFRFPPSLMQDTLNKHENLGEYQRNSLMGSMSYDCLVGREINNAFMDSDLTSSRIRNHPWDVGDKTRCSSLPKTNADPWQSTTTVHGVKCVSRSRGAVYNDDAADNAVCRSFWDPYLIQQSMLSHQLEKEAPDSTKECGDFSPFQDMECYKRVNTVSSSFPLYTGSRGGSRKRNADTNKYASAKYRKLGAED